jgi:2-haloacid dehalogenase
MGSRRSAHARDCNETLLDLRALGPAFERTFGDPQARERWFQQMLLLAFQATILDQYRPFGDHGLAALRMLAEQPGRRPAVVSAQLRHAGILDYFDWVFPADRALRLKPAPELYWLAVHEMGVTLEGTWLAAADGWDLAGAAAVGCRTAFLARPGKALNPLGPPPTLVAEDVEVLAGRLLVPDVAC